MINKYFQKILIIIFILFIINFNFSFSKEIEKNSYKVDESFIKSVNKKNNNIMKSSNRDILSHIENIDNNKSNLEKYYNLEKKKAYLNENGVKSIKLEFILNERNFYEMFLKLVNGDRKFKYDLEKYLIKNKDFILNEKINKFSCQKIKSKTYSFNPLTIYFIERLNTYLKIDTKDLDNFIGCLFYSDKNYNLKSEVNTDWAKYREVNIGKGLETIKNYLFIKGETISLYERLMTEKKYINGYALVRKNGRVISQLVNGGSICGVSTVFYQASLQSKDLVIKERSPHMNFYLQHYKIPGQDATIFGQGDKIMKDLKVNNQHGLILVKPYYNVPKKGKFRYGINFYSLTSFKKTEIINSKSWRKKGKRCYTNEIYYGGRKIKEIISCYFGIY